MAFKMMYLLLVCVCAADDIREDTTAHFKRVLSQIQNATIDIATRVDESIKRIVHETQTSVRMVAQTWDKSLQRLMGTSKKHNQSVADCLNAILPNRSVEDNLSEDTSLCLDETMEKSMRRVSDEMSKIMSVAVLVLHEYAQEAEACEMQEEKDAKSCMSNKMELVTQQQMRIAEQYMESANAAFLIVKEFTIFAVECTRRAIATRSAEANAIEQKIASCIREKTVEMESATYEE